MKTRIDTEWFKSGKIKSEYKYKLGFSVPFTPSFKITLNVKEDGQSEKLEESRIKLKKGFKPLFSKDVNDPSERGHD